ncbi:MAG: uroporphyrinogen III decarboxylase [Dictyoglomus sp. NZ13-RE01]|nr:MAG: uroporphyrinogen III decarboxylase [Dictyoglomus sp. NZ13-RE01]
MDLENFDLKEFWEENDYCLRNFQNKTRIPIFYWLDDHFLFELIDIESTIRYYTDYNYRLDCHKRANQILEKALGRKFYPEDPVEPPSPNRFEVLMGAKYVLTEGGTPWLVSEVRDIDDVKELIKKMEKVNMEECALPEDFYEKKELYEKETGKKIKLGSSSRGPATLATSILGTENLCIFMMEEEELLLEFYNVLCEKLIEYCRVLRKATKNQEYGFSIMDDNCFLFPPKKYLKFCAPFLERIFKEFAPLPHHLRYQHSDSNMKHLMGILNDLGINEVNFGPEIHPKEIRTAMPKAKIYGQMPPFTLRNGTYEEIISIVKRDMECLGGDGNFVECTAGSVASGTPLENIKLYMWAVDKFCRL